MNNLLRPDIYRIPERDEKPTRADKSMIGTCWKISQYVYRVGYEFQPLDFDHQEVQNKAESILQDVICNSLYYANLENDRRQALALLIKDRLIRSIGGQVLPMHQARGRLMHEAYGHSRQTGRERAMWFHNKFGYPYFDFTFVEITGIKQFVTGTYYEASGGNWGYEDWEDFEPAGLANRVNHSLYEATTFAVTTSGELMSGTQNILVHLDDLTEKFDLQKFMSNSW